MDDSSRAPAAQRAPRDAVELAKTLLFAGMTTVTATATRSAPTLLRIEAPDDEEEGKSGDAVYADGNVTQAAERDTLAALVQKQQRELDELRSQLSCSQAAQATAAPTPVTLPLQFASAAAPATRTDVFSALRERRAGAASAGLKSTLAGSAGTLSASQLTADGPLSLRKRLAPVAPAAPTASAHELTDSARERLDMEVLKTRLRDCGRELKEALPDLPLHELHGRRRRGA